MYYKLDRVRTFIFIYFVAFLLYNAFVLWLIEISYEPSYIGEDGNFFFLVIPTWLLWKIFKLLPIVLPMFTNWQTQSIVFFF